MADPTQVTQYQTGIAPELQPYAQSLLGQAKAYTDVGQNPYQSYTGERVAQFSPLQQQSYDYASQMRSAPQLQDATAMAGQAGLGALNAQYTYAPSNFTSDTAKSMMNPYMQNVVDVQKQQAIRDASIAQQGQQAQAAQAGAFGGGRDAIMRSQGNADLQRNLAGIQATGLNNAFTQAQNQYNTQYGQNAAQQQFGAGLGMQGLGIANQAAQNLGALGQTQYNQNMGITALQNQFGLQQQQQAQNLLNTKYEDFTNAQNYPFKQMAFMSDIIRGTPLSQTGASMYQAAPNTVQSLASLGLGAAGLSSLFKAEGGVTKSYADGGAVRYDGGGSVFNPGFKRYAVGHIDPRQLPLAQRNAQARGDLDTNQFAIQQMADDAAFRRGISAGLPQGVDVVRAAGGGILAFDKGGETEVDNSATTPTAESFADLLGGRVDPRAMAYARGAIGNLANTPQQVVTPEQQLEMTGKFYKQEEEQAGPNTGMEDYKSFIAKTETGLSRALEEGKGMALLEAANAVLQPGGTMRGIGAAGAAFARSYGQALQADRAEKTNLAKSKFLLADAERKERMGFTTNARNATAAQIKSVQEANKQSVLKNKYIADAAVNLAKATKQSGAGGKKDRYQELYYAQEQEFAKMKPTDPGYEQAKVSLDAAKATVDRLRTSDIGKAKTEQGNAAQTEKRVSDEATAWSQNYKGRQSQRAYAIANGIKTGASNPSWKEQARQHHRENFGKTAPAGGGTTLRFDANGQPIQ